MLYMTFEDLSGEIEVLVFPSQVKRFDPILKEENLCVLQGNLDVQEEKPTKIRLESIELLETKTLDFKKLYIKMNSDEKEKLDMVKAKLLGGYGTVPVIIYYEDTKERLQAPKSMWLKNDECIPELEKVLGVDSVKKVK